MIKCGDKDETINQWMRQKKCKKIKLDKTGWERWFTGNCQDVESWPYEQMVHENWMVDWTVPVDRREKNQRKWKERQVLGSCQRKWNCHCYVRNDPSHRKGGWKSQKSEDELRLSKPQHCKFWGNLQSLRFQWKTIS